jgi:hypothetical protein
MPGSYLQPVLTIIIIGETQRNVLIVLGALAKLRKATISFVMSVCPSAWKNSAPTEWNFMTLGLEYFSKMCRGKPSFMKI